MRQSHTAVLARNEIWKGSVATEPYEVAWASEALFFLRVLEPVSTPDDLVLDVQISPDGIHWCPHGAVIRVSGDPQSPASVAVRDFGGWLRLSGDVPAGVELKVIAYLALKE